MHLLLVLPPDIIPIKNPTKPELELKQHNKSFQRQEDTLTKGRKTHNLVSVDTLGDQNMDLLKATASLLPLSHDKISWIFWEVHYVVFTIVAFSIYRKYGHPFPKIKALFFSIGI